MLQPVTASPLAALEGIAHGFFTRRGGVSRGGYASLNCGLGSRDDPQAVGENRRRVAAHLGAQDLVTAHQVHSATAVIVERCWTHPGERPRADAMVTARPGLALGVLTADCAPVLLADPAARVAAAAHAGWRGLIGGVIEATLAAMERLGAQRDRIEAAVGPCIGAQAYEVGWDFEREFLARDPASESHFLHRDPRARPHFDLAGYALARLVRAGVARAVATGACTYARGEDFFSYRRSQAGGEPDYGRQISAIVLT